MKSLSVFAFPALWSFFRVVLFVVEEVAPGYRIGISEGGIT